jgi:hypothetical protein
MLKAGTILLLVGSILDIAGAFFLVLVGTLMLALGRNFLGDGDASFPFAVIGALYLVLGVLLAAGALVGFGAWGRAKAGDARGGWVRGLVASLLPPIRLLTLVGAILCLVSPEGEAQGRARAASQAP